MSPFQLHVITTVRARSHGSTDVTVPEGTTGGKRPDEGTAADLLAFASMPRR